MTTSPTPPSPSTRYLVIWRETPSPNARLRTYVDQAGPLSYLLHELSPIPLDSRIITDSAQLDAYLASSSTEAHAVTDSLARDYLGWEPTPAT